MGYWADDCDASGSACDARGGHGPATGAQPRRPARPPRRDRAPCGVRGGWGGGLAAYRDTYEEWREFILGYLAWETANVTAVCLRDGDRVVGTTTLGDFDLANGSAHIGWTAYAPEVWGTRVNAETKRLLLGTAFDHGFERVKLQADVLNERSRAAILRLGATFEGVLRHTQPRADGTWRDTAVYSVLREEWPAVRDGLDARLAAQTA
ncbi:GNAT family N-acetyltransferase [Leifsonia sp. L25]|uniref:GNAT family N-acetyltransferase n=1 Tax=Actinomycetes TaxID=1760 RepID=UPI003D69019F